MGIWTNWRQRPLVSSILLLQIHSFHIPCKVASVFLLYRCYTGHCSSEFSLSFTPFLSKSLTEELTGILSLSPSQMVVSGTLFPHPSFPLTMINIPSNTLHWGTYNKTRHDFRPVTPLYQARTSSEFLVFSPHLSHRIIRVLYISKYKSVIRSGFPPISSKI